jgi:hypothetical protein
LPYNSVKARKNLGQGKKNLSQVKKKFSQSTVYILPKHPHMIKTPTRPEHMEELRYNSTVNLGII